MNACLRAQTQDGPIRPGQLHVAIIGAGATGTESAAELHRTLREVVAYGLDRIDPQCDIRIVLIEAADRVLPGLPERISEAMQRLLDGMGIQVRTGAKVTEVTTEGLRLGDGSFIPSELAVWAAGVKAPEVLRNLDGVEVNRINQLIFQPTLETTRDPDIFAMATAPPVRAGMSPPRCRRAPRPRTRKPRTWSDRSSAACAGALASFRTPRLRLTGFARQTQHGWGPDGVSVRSQPFHRRPVRTGDVPIVAHDPRPSPERQLIFEARLALTRSVAPHRPTG